MQKARKLLQAAEVKLASGGISQETFDKIRKAATSVNPQLAAADGNDEPATDLLALSERGEVDGVQQLLAEGANPNTANDQGTTPLLVAIRRGHVDVVEALVEAGADVDQAGAWDYTPLMYAAIWGQTQIARILLRHGADPRPKDKIGDTALQHAVREHQPEIAEMLRALVELQTATPSSATFVELEKEESGTSAPGGAR